MSVDEESTPQTERLLGEFRAKCAVPFSVINGHIVTCRKLRVQPPIALIPPSVLSLWHRYNSGEIREVPNDPLSRSKVYHSRNVLRRYALIPDRERSTVTNADSCRKWRQKHAGLSKQPDVVPAAC